MKCLKCQYHTTLTTIHNSELQARIAFSYSMAHISSCEECIAVELAIIMSSQSGKDRLRSAAPAAGLHQLQLAGNLGKASFIDFVEEDLQIQH